MRECDGCSWPTRHFLCELCWHHERTLIIRRYTREAVRRIVADQS